jgi:hypothetical protein
LELLEVSRCGPAAILYQVQELLEQRQNFPSLAKIILGFVDKVQVRWFDEAGLTPSPEASRDLRRLEQELIADGMEMGVDVVLVHLRDQVGINTDFEAGFHFDYILSP